MERAQKQNEIEGLKNDLKDVEIVIVSHNKGMTVSQVNTLRSGLRKTGAKYKVTKNTLAKIATKGTAHEALSDMLKGPTGLTTSKDALSATKAIYEFAKNSNEKLVILGGFYNNELIDAKKIELLAKMPSLNELRGKLVGLLQAPAAQLARVMKAYADKDNAASAAE